MGSSYKYLRGSDGTGNAVLAHITSPRSIGSTTIIVDSVSKWSPFYIVTTGLLDVNGYMTPASMTEMYAHTNAGQIIIDGFVPGYTDVGNTAGQVAIVKPTNHFANSVVDQALVSQNDDGTLKDTALDIFYKPTEVMQDFIVPGGAVLTGTGYGTTLGWSLSAGIVYIGGKRYTVAAATGVVVASKDTYFDLLATTPGQPATLVLTGGNSVANNAASPALAANSVRLGIITSAANIAAATSINQGQEDRVLPIISSTALSVSDSLGNLICPRDPNRKVLGYAQVLTSQSGFASETDVTGVNTTVKTDGFRKAKITANIPNINSTVQYDKVQINIKEGATTVYNGQQTLPTNAGLGTGALISIPFTPTAGTHTYKVSILRSNGTGTIATNAGATSPAYILVEQN